jgi:hypothetical protein
METIKNTAIGLTLFIFLTLIFPSCSSATEPLADNATPGRRDYTWTVDTLNLIGQYDSYDKMWGAAPDDVWCYGQGDIDKMMLRYDGKTIKPFPMTHYMQPWSIFGLTADEFWIGGEDSDIWRYKNGQITKFGDYILDGYRVIFNDIWGENANDLYAVGAAYKTSNGQIYDIIMHYDGTNWQYVVKPDLNLQFTKIRRGINQSKNYYLQAYKDNAMTGDSLGIYEFDGKNLQRIYFQNETRANYPGILMMNNNLYFGFQKKLHIYANGQFSTIIDLSAYNIYGLGQMFGRNEKDIFVFMEDGLGHYNGTDLTTIYKGNWGLGIHNGLLFDKDLFVICADWNNKYYLLHGKLN